jgi:hypothetical protein
VGIENNDERNFKDLRGMRRSAKPLKNNMRACKGILIAPSKLPRFSRFPKFPLASVVHHCPTSEVGFGYKSRGTDGKPTLTITPGPEPRRSTLLEVRKARVSSSSRFRLPAWNLGIYESRDLGIH